MASWRADNDKCAPARGGDEVLAEGTRECGVTVRGERRSACRGWCGRSGREREPRVGARQHVAVGPLHHAKLSQVAREGGLGHRDAMPLAQRRRQVELAPELLGREQCCHTSATLDGVGGGVGQWGKVG